MPIFKIGCEWQAVGSHFQPRLATVAPPQQAGQHRSGSVAHVLLDAIALSDKSPLEDDSSFLVPLALLSGKLVHPAELGVAVLAGYIAYHVPASQHHSVLHLAIIEVDHFVEEERPSRGASESCTDELTAICQNGVAARAREQSRTSNVIEEDATHVDW